MRLLHAAVLLAAFSPLPALAQTSSASLANSTYLTTANTAALNLQTFTIEARIAEAQTPASMAHGRSCFNRGGGI